MASFNTETDLDPSIIFILILTFAAVGAGPKQDDGVQEGIRDEKVLSRPRRTQKYFRLISRQSSPQHYFANNCPLIYFFVI